MKIVAPLVLIAALGGAAFLYLNRPLPQLLSPLAPTHPRLLTNYAFYNLQRRRFVSQTFKYTATVKKSAAFTSRTFAYLSDGHLITGLANIPNVAPNAKLPVIIMIRGYVDPNAYAPGVGTQPAASYLAEKGFLTLAPDFLGYGGSDEAFSDSLKTRFDAPVEVLNLIADVALVPEADSRKIGIWAHSNGGQIALSALEISRQPYPTSLWAPVSQSFPESVLHYASEMPDNGVYLNKIIDDFVQDYDPQHYSIADYLGWINAPMVVHQGGQDEEVPPAWSDNLVTSLRQLGKNVLYFTYPKEDHNFNRGSAPILNQRDADFFKKNLGMKTL